MKQGYLPNGYASFPNLSHSQQCMVYMRITMRMHICVHDHRMPITFVLTPAY
jgi:hypothetical protein